jgi:predicted XRE-type DNA-binding protein
VTEPHGNVFADIGFPPAEAENLRMRAQLMDALVGLMRRESLTQTRAARRFGVSQPRISDLKRGLIDRFTIDALINMLASAGIRVEIALPRSA